MLARDFYTEARLVSSSSGGGSSPKARALTEGKQETHIKRRGMRCSLVGTLYFSFENGAPGKGAGLGLGNQTSSGFETLARARAQVYLV